MLAGQGWGVSAWKKTAQMCHPQALALPFCWRPSCVHSSGPVSHPHVHIFRCPQTLQHPLQGAEPLLPTFNLPKQETSHVQAELWRGEWPPRRCAGLCMRGMGGSFPFPSGLQGSRSKSPRDPCTRPLLHGQPAAVMRGALCAAPDSPSPEQVPPATVQSIFRCILAQCGADTFLGRGTNVPGTRLGGREIAVNPSPHKVLLSTLHRAAWPQVPSQAPWWQKAPCLPSAPWGERSEAGKGGRRPHRGFSFAPGGWAGAWKPCWGSTCRWGHPWRCVPGSPLVWGRASERNVTWE